MKMKVKILCIGDELLLGNTINTNAFFLSKHLRNIGMDTTSHEVVSDDKDMLFFALKESIEKYDIVIITGGLGPTDDDHTMEVLRKILDIDFDDYYFDEKIYQRLVKKSGGIENKYLKSQAHVLKNAILLKNEIGTATGYIIEKDDKAIIVLPGVPDEMKDMFLKKALDFLKKKISPFKKIMQKDISICLKPENEVEAFLEELRKDKIYNKEDISIGIYPHYANVKVSIRALEKDEKKAIETIDILIQRIKDKFGPYVFSTSSKSIEEEIKEIFIKKKKTLFLAESCTGGDLSAMLTKLPDSSLYFLGGVVSYSNDIKENILKVPKNLLESKGAVSLEVVEQMALSAIDISRSDYSIAISGIAGPYGGTKKKPLGTVYFAVAEKGKHVDVGYTQVFGNREFIIKYSSCFALSLLWVKINSNLTYFSKKDEQI